MWKSRSLARNYERYKQNEKNELEALGFRVYVLDTIERITEIVEEIVGGTGDEIHSV